MRASVVRNSRNIVRASRATQARVRTTTLVSVARQLALLAHDPAALYDVDRSAAVTDPAIRALLLEGYQKVLEAYGKMGYPVTTDDNFTETAAFEWAPVRVNALHPGIVGDSPYWSVESGATSPPRR